MASVSPAPKVLTLRAIAWGAAVIVAVGLGVATWLLLAYGDGNADANRNKLDAIRTAGTIVVGSGGAVALLLAARRQRSTEIAHVLQDQIAEDARLDAAERRITDLYSTSVEQLGSEKAAVRLGGLYALERLAQNVPEQRQTIVNVICAYLRMPYQLPDTDLDVDENRDREQERQVRFTAQRILTLHLRPGPDLERPTARFWTDIDLDLTGALLTELDLSDCRMRTARFTRATFAKDARFDGVTVTGNGRFAEAVFTGRARFERGTIMGNAWFMSAAFVGSAHFDGVQFGKRVSFDNATFAHGIPDQLAPHARAEETG